MRTSTCPVCSSSSELAAEPDDEPRQRRDPGLVALQDLLLLFSPLPWAIGGAARAESCTCSRSPLPDRTARKGPATCSPSR
jgi:hypothetical protein